MLCRKCGIREQEGFIFLLCSPCFDELDKLADIDSKKASEEIISINGIANSMEFAENIENDEEIKKEIN